MVYRYTSWTWNDQDGWQHHQRCLFDIHIVRAGVRLCVDIASLHFDVLTTETPYQSTRTRMSCVCISISSTPESIIAFRASPTAARSTYKEHTHTITNTNRCIQRVKLSIVTKSIIMAIVMGGRVCVLLCMCVLCVALIDRFLFHVGHAGIKCVEGGWRGEQIVPYEAHSTRNFANYSNSVSARDAQVILVLVKSL